MLMIASALRFFPDPRGFSSSTINAVVLMLMGGAALFGALRLSSHRVAAASVSERTISAGRVQWMLVLPGFILLAIGTEMSANALRTGLLIGQSAHLQFVTLLAGLVLFTVGMIGTSSLLKPNIVWREALPLLVIVGLAFIIRVYQLGTLIRVPMDEGHYMTGVSVFRDPVYVPKLLTMINGYLPTTAIFSYWNYIATLIFGRDFFGLRIVSAIIGSLTVIVVYSVGRTLFNRRIGLVAALILATFPSHVWFSRMALGYIADAFFASLMVLFAARGFRWNQRQDWVLLGVSFGLAQYFFEAGRLVIPPIFVCWVIVTALVLRRKFKPLRRGIFLATITGLVVITPVYFTIWSTGAPIVTRMRSSGVDLTLFERALKGELNEAETRYMTNHLTDPFLVYTSYSNNGLQEMYGGFEPLMLRIFIPLFLLGLFHLLYRIRSAGTLLLIAILGTSAGNILVANAVIFPRYVVIIPLLAIVIAVGIGCTLPMLNPFLKYELTASSTPEAHRRWQGTLVYSVAVLVSVVQLFYFFGRMIPEYNYYQRSITRIGDTMDATMRFAERPNVLHEQMLIYDYYFGNGLVPTSYITYTTGRGDYPVEMWVSGDMTLEDLNALPRDRTYVFSVLPSDLRMIQLLHQSFALEPPMYSSYDSPVPRSLYLMFVAPHEKNRYPLHATPAGSGTVP